jgi:predicted HTH domain antitoxin
MQITVDLPDDIAGHSDPGREALEALASEGYRSGALTHYQACQLLGMSRFEFDDFLKSRQVDDHAYDTKDFEQDLACFGSSRMSRPPAGHDRCRGGYIPSELPRPDPLPRVVAGASDGRRARFSAANRHCPKHHRSSPSAVGDRELASSARSAICDFTFASGTSELASGCSHSKRADMTSRGACLRNRTAQSHGCRAWTNWSSSASLTSDTAQ